MSYFQKKCIFAAVYNPIIINLKIQKEMKKVMAIFGAALMLAGIATSCSKTCQCTTTTPGLPTSTTEVTIKSGKCSDMNTETTTMGITQKVECVQK